MSAPWFPTGTALANPYRYGNVPEIARTGTGTPGAAAVRGAGAETKQASEFIECSSDTLTRMVRVLKRERIVAALY